MKKLIPVAAALLLFIAGPLSASAQCTISAHAVVANVDSACATSPVLLTDTGAFTGTMAWQWQSSPDSATWTDIATATAGTWTVPGLTVSTWYRCVRSCASAGIVPSAGKKIRYTATCPCTGTPPAAFAMSSTPFCDFCTLTLTRYSPATSGLTHQWQVSSGSTTPGLWFDLPGATSEASTFDPMSFGTSPFISSGNCFYRCKSTCAITGSASYSGHVEVPNHFFIDPGPVVNSMDTVCNLANLLLSVFGDHNPLAAVKTTYGDGTSDSAALGILSIPGYGVGYPVVTHHYTAPGRYRIKHELYYNNILQDSFVRSYDFLECNAMPIKIYMTNDGDCVKSDLEPLNAAPVNVVVDSAGITIDTISATAGLYYRALGPLGTIYSFRLLPGARTVSCPASGVIFDTLTPSSNGKLKYFAMSCGTGGSTDMAVNCVVQGTGRINQWGHIYVRNLECAPGDAVLNFRYSHKYGADFFSHTTPAAAVVPDITWNLSSVGMFTGVRDIFFRNSTSLSALLDLGDTVVERIRVSMTGGTETDTTNNEIERVDTVTGSYDPNFIAANPPGCFDTATHFQFTVHFENTGNDTAHNIYIMDTLSEYLDSHSLELVMSSAKEMNIMPYTEGGYNIVKFDFPNIKLLDSSWHGLNDGAFIYNIRTKGTLATGSVIRSRVGIYFDYNDAVMTNTTENTKGCPVAPAKVALVGSRPALYPNPVSGVLTITTGGQVYTSLTISNAVGQQFLEQPISASETKINVSAFPAGVYFVTFAGDSGRVTERFVKL